MAAAVGRSWDFSAVSGHQVERQLLAAADSGGQL